MNFATIDLIARAALAQGDSGTAPPAQSPLGSPIFFILMLLFFMYFFVMRPQQKRERQRRLMLGALGKGDAVITTGGIKGTIVGLSDSSVVLRVDDNTKIEFVRQAVAQVIPKDAESKQD
jgi:preprotein translocase subunit YajC